MALPSTIRPTSKNSSPMSLQMTFVYPLRLATSIAPTSPPTGPEATAWYGLAIASAGSTTPPVDCMISIDRFSPPRSSLSLSAAR